MAAAAVCHEMSNGYIAGTGKPENILEFNKCYVQSGEV